MRILKLLYRWWLFGLACAVLLVGLGLYAFPRPVAVSPLPAEAGKPIRLALPATVPAPFDPEKSTHLISVAPLQGMRLLDDGGPLISITSPGSALLVQVIRRDPTPEPLALGEAKPAAPPVAPPAANATTGEAPADAAKQTAAVSLGWSLPDDMRKAEDASSRTSGPLETDPRFADGRSRPVPAVPYTVNGTYAPAPALEVAPSGAAMTGATRITLAASSEIGCRNCHGGGWKNAGGGGLGPDTAKDILRVHDRKNGTDLLDTALSGTTVACRSCHGGDPRRPGFSAAIHGFHATMGLKEEKACYSCHPGNPAYPMLRGVHASRGLTCVNCHGPLEDHALSLLKAEAEKPAVQARMKTLRPRYAASAAAIAPRAPGRNLPKCAACHDFVKRPQAGPELSAFNKWTADESERFTRMTENTGKLRCPSCHGAPHALYPAGRGLDNLQPAQYGAAGPLGSTPSGKEPNSGCAACHTVPMDYFIHHDLPEK